MVNKQNSSVRNSKLEISSTVDRGKNAEKKAEQFLQHKGYKILLRNFRKRGGELDLIVFAPEGGLVFVEIRSSITASPYLHYSIGRIKMLRLQKMVQKFLFQNPRYQKLPYRMDVIWIEGEKIEHWVNVELASDYSGFRNLY